MKSTDIIMTTAPSVEGYRIVKQCGIVFGETIFKHGMSARSSAMISDVVDTMKWGSRELSGTMSLIEQAREYAYDKLERAARDRGANAIIGIDSDNTFYGDGNLTMYLSLYGTAVKIVTEEEYQRILAKKREEAERANEEYLQKQYELNKNRIEFEEQLAAGEKPKEAKLFESLDDAKTLRELWNLWNQIGLNDKYPEISELLSSRKEMERMYGATPHDLALTKKKLREMLFGDDIWPERQ